MCACIHHYYLLQLIIEKEFMEQEFMFPKMHTMQACRQKESLWPHSVGLRQPNDLTRLLRVMFMHKKLQNVSTVQGLS